MSGNRKRKGATRRHVPEHAYYLGFDVGKGSHWACLVDASGELAAGPGGAGLLNREVENRREAVREALALAPAGTLVVTDQRRNIGALVLREAAGMGLDVAYLPGLSVAAARALYPGDAKSDARDAWLIAKTAQANGEALLPVPDEGDLGQARLLAGQRRHLVGLRTATVNRLRAVLLEADPAFEALLDPACAWQLGILAELGGPAGVAAASTRRLNSLAKRLGAPAGAQAALREVAAGAGPRPPAEDEVVRQLAGDALALSGRIADLEARAREALGENEAYRCLLTVPGIGHVTAEALVALVDPSKFRRDAELAAFCGLVPRDSESGVSIDSSTATGRGNRELKSLLIFTAGSLVGTDTYLGRYYDRAFARYGGQPGGRTKRDRLARKKALKATARKRLRIIWAVMRDRVPYDPSRWEAAA